MPKKYTQLAFVPLNRMFLVATLALGLQPRQRACKGIKARRSLGVKQEEAWESRQEEEARESHHILPRV